MKQLQSTREEDFNPQRATDPRSMHTPLDFADLMAQNFTTVPYTCDVWSLLALISYELARTNWRFPKMRNKNANKLDMS
ncbi:hypothetical protein KSC_043730 [Ktedonobacter sp. SOSP1-52]|nr:hypothetical protein KSC_043730 [Ktedonobacter sp. SOSP1-52]